MYPNAAINATAVAVAAAARHPVRLLLLSFTREHSSYLEEKRHPRPPGDLRLDLLETRCVIFTFLGLGANRQQRVGIALALISFSALSLSIFVFHIYVESYRAIRI